MISTSQKVFESKTNESKITYNKQQNACVSLFRETKRYYFTNVEIIEKQEEILKNRQFFVFFTFKYCKKNWHREPTG